MTVQSEKNTSVRIDKWLWACRFYKTRAVAKDHVESGKVRLGGNKIKPSFTVQLGQHFSVRQGDQEKIIEVMGFSEKRLSAPLAQQLYQETSESTAARIERTKQRSIFYAQAPTSERPNKKQRRQITRFVNKNQES